MVVWGFPCRVESGIIPPHPANRDSRLILFGWWAGKGGVVDRGRRRCCWLGECFGWFVPCLEHCFSAVGVWTAGLWRPVPVCRGGRYGVCVLACWMCYRPRCVTFLFSSFFCAICVKSFCSFIHIGKEREQFSGSGVGDWVWRKGKVGQLGSGGVVCGRVGTINMGRIGEGAKS